ncbi:FecR family protein [Pedobacter panaciterrae]|uniref:FecR family protein n=1 Tax=Pedobacter panaciterrae TaxID=363849 RepID=UPI0025980DAD|nr:FecR domain-containing protein [uncultured Pedobacter sp.]
MNDEQVKDLLERFQAGACSDRELEKVRYWLHKFREDERSGLSQIDLETIDDQMWQPILKATKPETARMISWPLRVAVSTASIIVLGVFIYFFTKDTSNKTYVNNIDPGKNTAVLILSDGKKINLLNAKIGLLALQSTTQITKTKEGEIIYTSRHELPPLQNGGKSSYSEISNTIRTPRGGQYKLSLPDGTKVWLNAASSLTYPISFDWLKERRIELNGEAYFEVAKDKLHPFLVQSKTQTVKVLGTRFNISAYSDDQFTNTTLLEGIVQVNQVTLKPGQQAVNSGAAIKVNAVDPNDVIAWKDGEFSFRNEPLQNIMKKISRWYNVDVVYQNKEAGKQIFGGTISKYGKISEILHILELTGDVKFRLEGKTITVL